MNQMSIGREPDFLMKFGQVEVMHTVSVRISAINNQPQMFKIVDRSFHTVCLKLKELLNAKTSMESWKLNEKKAGRRNAI